MKSSTDLPGDELQSLWCPDDTAYWSAYPHDVWRNYSLLQLCDLPFMWLCLCPEKIPHHNAQGGSSETATFMLTLNMFWFTLHRIYSTSWQQTPRDRTWHSAAGTFSPRAPCVSWQKLYLPWRIHCSLSEQVYLICSNEQNFTGDCSQSIWNQAQWNKMSH